MLPTRAYSNQITSAVAPRVAAASATDARPTLLVAAATMDIELFPKTSFLRTGASSTAEAVVLIQRDRPRIVVIDWDDHERFDGTYITATAHQRPGTAVLVTMMEPEAAPTALKAGCNAVLLKPLTLNLTTARLGRLAREMPSPEIAARL